MRALGEIDWGELDAYKDDNLVSSWTESAGIKRCLDSRCWIISGEKGSGKSALSLSVSRLYAPSYFAIRLINFDDVTFKAIYENLKSLTSSTTMSSIRVLSNFWQYAIILELVTACYQASPKEYYDVWRRFPTAFRKTKKPSETILMLIQRAFDSLVTNIESVEDSGSRGLPASSGADATFLSDLAKAPLTDDFANLCSDFYDRLIHLDHRAVVIFDGFDTLRNDLSDPSSIQTVFASLAAAIQNMLSGRPRPKNVVVKAFIPHDQFLSISLRDSDKLSGIHASIKWDRKSLEEFVGKRIANSTSLKTGQFDKLWQEVMPLKFHNSRYGLEESTFDYLVRHTMLRPRQMQIHLKHLAYSTDGRNVQPFDIAKSVKESSIDLAKYFISEYRLTNPVLDYVFQTLDNENNIIPMKTLKRHVQVALRKLASTRVPTGPKEEIDQRVIEITTNKLFASGFFGIVRAVRAGDYNDDIYYPPSKTGSHHFVDFFYKNAVVDICSKVSEDTQVAIHPIFHGYCDMRRHSDFIVG